MPIRAGGSGRSTLDFVRVSKSRIDPAQSLVARKRRDHGPQLRPAFLPGQRDAQRSEIAPDGFQLAHERARVDAAVRAQQRDAVEAFAERRRRLAVSIGTLGLANGPCLPLEPEPAQVADDLLFAAGHVPSRIGVVDSQQHPVAELPVGDRAERVPNVQGTGRAGGKTDALHLRPSLESAPVEAALLAWFAAHRRDLPWRRTRDPYAILVSEVMLQQTQVERVVPRYLDWLERWPTAEALAAASPAEVIRAWQGAGHNRRALNLYRAAHRIAQHGWPEDLTELPGVGRYTADAITRFAFEQPVLPLDTNVKRVLERTGGEFG